MLRKIAITGPESTGKTTLCRLLAEHYQCLMVPEMARLILERDGPEYDATKVEQMAWIQLEEEKIMENQAKEKNHPYLFSDTNLLVYQVWMEFRYGYCPEWIKDEVKHSNYDLQLLLKPDIPWQADPLRENPHNREQIYLHYETLLQNQKGRWESIGGVQRFPLALMAIGEIP